MAIFSELGKKISETTQSAVKGTKDFAETTKLNAQISDEQKAIDNAHMQIGRLYYDRFSATVEDEEFAALCAAITGHNQKIAVLKTEIQKIKGIKKCAGCGAEIQIATIFCGFCGFDTRTATEEGEQTAEQVPRCTGCNKELAPGVAFCTGCGQKVEN